MIMLRALVYTAVSSVASDNTRPTLRITGSSLLRRNTSVQSTAKDNPYLGVTK